MERPIEREMVIAPQSQSKNIGNFLVVTEDDKIYKVISEEEGHEEDTWLAHPVKVLPYRPLLGPTLPWEMVGIFRLENKKLF